MRQRKTSEGSPLRLDFIPTKFSGEIAITFCPGKYQPNAETCFWDRDLDLDLRQIRDYDTNNKNPVSTIVTLIEEHEFENLRVEHLGSKAEQLGFSWFHLPFKDGHHPHVEWLKDWGDKKSQLISSLESGENVMIHCKGGIGRAGTVSALLLHEIGYSIQEAIDLVRKYRKESCIERAVPPGAKMSQQEWLLENFS
jgi:ADP-ribosyl-[dinitrogen reductase] hydrolase